MLRTALKPKWLGLLGVVILIVIAFIQLGRWQLGVARDHALEEQIAKAQAQRAAVLDDVLKPHQPFPGELSGRPVTATGTYAADEQVLIADRRLDGRGGYWVITALRTTEGPILPVLRGFVADAAQAGAPPRGLVTVEGGLAPGESPARDSGMPTLPEGQMRSVDLAVLVNQWPGDLYNAFLFLSHEASGAGDGGDGAAAAADLNTLTHVPTPTGAVGFQWRNAAYAAQWWVFALFALWMWGRMVRDDFRKRSDGEGADATPAHGIPDAGRE